MGQGPSANPGTGEDPGYLSEYGDHPSDDGDHAYQPATLKDEVMQMVSGNFSDGSTPSGSDSKAEDVLVPLTFSWKHGGKEVFITGSFNQWLGKIPMKRAQKNEFNLTLDVPPGKHHYKFIVDDKWRFAPDQDTEMDGEGRVNNIIEAKAPIKTEGTANMADEDQEDVSLYGQNIPALDEYSADPPILPPHLGVVLLNNSMHISSPVAGHGEFETSAQLQCARDLDPVTLPVPQHVTLNHLYVSLKRNATPGEEGVTVVGLTQRYKNKFFTTVYYKPKQHTHGKSASGSTKSSIDSNHHMIEGKA